MSIRHKGRAWERDEEGLASSAGSPAAEEIIAWAAAEGLVLETFPVERVGEFYEEAPHGRSARLHRL